MKDNRLNSIRIPYPMSEDGAYFTSVLDMIEKYGCGIGEVALFTSVTHAPLTLDELKKRIEIFKRRMPEARARGLKAGINILASIGHHNEDLDNSVKGPYTHMTDIHGNICHGSYCMNDERYLNEYIVPAYTAMAEASPDFIWIDDDVRYGHMPIKYACFCDRCIEKFNKQNGWSYTREELREALDSGNLEVRRAYLKKNSDAIVNLMKVIGKTVRGVNDKIKLGYMTGERYFEGYEFERYADALSDGGKYEIMWRPGGGAYVDYTFDAIIEKASEIGRQVAYLPDYVTVRASELENFPDDGLGKTPHSTAQEVLLEVATGCYGSAFNFLPMTVDEPLRSVEPIFKKLSECNDFENLLAGKLHDADIIGIHTGWMPSSQIAAPKDCDYSRFYPSPEYGNYAKEMFDLGLPEAYDISKASVIMLRKTAAAAMSDELIKDLLSRGVYMDAEALDYLNSRGFGKYTGFALGKEIPIDAHERYLECDFNEGAVGARRNCRQAFYPGPSFSIIPTDKNARVIADLVDYHDTVLADAAMGIFENELGGRVCVAGYYPYQKLLFFTKNTQLKRVMDYLSHGNLGAYVRSHTRARLWSYKAKDASFAVLFNMTNQEWEDVEIAINGESARIYSRFDLDGKCAQITDGILSIDKLPPYEMLLIEVK